MSLTFKRPRFSPTSPEAEQRNGQDAIASLPDLIRFNARENPEHIFCMQAETAGASQYNSQKITFSQLDRAVDSCATWIHHAVKSSFPGNSGGTPHRPVALYLESDIGLFIHLAALLTMNIPILLISARLSSPSVLHLLEKTNASTILVSRRTRKLLSAEVDEFIDVRVTSPYVAFLHGSRKPPTTSNGAHIPETTNDTAVVPDSEKYWRAGPAVDERNRNAVILHSSGTTGLPKPIYMAHRYLLGYAACHEISPAEDATWINMSTLPLYHGFGLLAPALSLSIGMTCLFPPSSIIPAAHSTLELIQQFDARSLMTVPSIIDDMLTSLGSAESKQAMEQVLASLKFVAVGGGALNPSRAETLAAHSVKLLNHYGVTEIGAIAPIFPPGPDYDWHYLRLRTDLGLQLRPIEGSANFRLVGYPCGWDGPFEIQDELERRPGSDRVEVRVLGRTDDLIVLKTGEKVMPRKIEEALNADSRIKTSVCVGQGFFEVIVIVEPVAGSDEDPESVKEYVWKQISNINPELDQHARISSKEAIIIKPASKFIPRSDKGSVMRREVHDLFKEEIEAAYTAMESNMPGASVEFDTAHIETSLHKMINALVGNAAAVQHLDLDGDFFENGMDSMQALRFSRLLNAAFSKMKAPGGGDVEKVTPEFIYRNPTVKQLTAAVKRVASSNGTNDGVAVRDRASEMVDLAEELTSKMRRQNVILLTGATGNLGAHSLARLLRTSPTNKVVCLIRNHKTAGGAHNANRVNGKEHHLSERLRAALLAAGIELTAEEQSRVEIQDLKILQSGKNDDRDTLLNLATRVTHILHLAWPMDFNRTLQSFRPHLELVQAFVDLARMAHYMRPGRQRVRLLFASSIAVVRHYNGRSYTQGTTNGSTHTVVPEVKMSDPLVAAPLGYAEAKWVCERILDHAGREFGAEVEPVVVRIGQISGPESTDGTWKTAEHLPKLVQASQKVGAFPRMDGAVSWLPVDRAANSLVEILLHNAQLDRFLHVENPTRQPMSDISAAMAQALRLSNTEGIPFDQWLDKARNSGTLQSLEGFFSEHFRELAHGAVTLDTHKSTAVSAVLRGSSSISNELSVRYIERWRKEGFLQ